MQQRFPFVISVKHKSRIPKKKTQLSSFNLNFKVDKPVKEIKQTKKAIEEKKLEEIDTKKLGKLLINGFAFLYNKYNDIINYLINKHKDKKIKLDTNNIKLQEAVMKLFGEPREYITFEEYVQLIELGYKYSEVIGKRQVGTNV